MKFWEKVKSLRLQDWANLIIIIGLPLMVFTLYENSLSQTANFVLEFNKELRNNQPSFSKLIYAIDYKRPLLSPKGDFTTEDLDNFLVTWEILNSIYSNTHFGRYMIYDAFSYDVENAYCYPEIREYIKSAKQDAKDPEVYRGFEDLAEHFIKIDRTDCAKINGD